MSEGRQRYGDDADESPGVEIENRTIREGFVLVPKSVLRSVNVSLGAKVLYGLLLDYAWQDGSCFPGYARLCADLQCSEPTARAYMRELADAELIGVKRRGQGRTNVYFLLERKSGADPERKNLSIKSETRVLSTNTQSTKTQSTKTQSTKTQLGSRESALSAHDVAIHAYYAGIGRDPLAVGKAYRQHLVAGAEIAKAGYSAVDVQHCATWLYSDPWRQEKGKPPTLADVAAALPLWIQRGRPAKQRATNGHGSDDRLAPVQGFLARHGANERADDGRTDIRTGIRAAYPALPPGS